MLSSRRVASSACTCQRGSNSRARRISTGQHGNRRSLFAHGPLRSSASEETETSVSTSNNYTVSRSEQVAVIEQPQLPTKVVFEPRVDAAAAGAQLAVLASVVGLAAYWWLVVVPTERGMLARDKRKGAVSEYLQEVNKDPSRRVEQWFYANWLRSSWFQRLSKRSEASATQGDAVEQQELPGASVNPNLLQPAFRTPTPSFWSLDNPVLATVTGLMVIGVVSTLLTGQ